jgi:hypothetical protein
MEHYLLKYEVYASVKSLYLVQVKVHYCWMFQLIN